MTPCDHIGGTGVALGHNTILRDAISGGSRSSRARGHALGSFVYRRECLSPIVANDTMLRIDEGVRQMWSVPTLMRRSEGALRGIFTLPREYEAARG